MPKEEADLVSDLRYTWRKVRMPQNDSTLTLNLVKPWPCLILALRPQISHCCDIT